MAVNLETSYLGLKLRNPLVAAANPLTGDPEVLLRMEEAGVAAVVLPSVFEEQIRDLDVAVDTLYHDEEAESQEELSYSPTLDDYNSGIETYLRLVDRASRRLSIPVIASLSGQSAGPWLRFGRAVEEVGAAALELNLDLGVVDPQVPGTTIENRYVEIVRSVKEQVSIPVALKVGPYFSALANVALRLDEAGLDGIVLFNRYPQPDIDVRTCTVRPVLNLSHSAESLLSLRWLAVLASRIPRLSLAANTGIHSWQDGAKALLAGADAIQLASAIILNGPSYFELLLSQLRTWMEETQLASMDAIHSRLSRRTSPTHGFERVDYVHAFTTFDLD